MDQRIKKIINYIGVHWESELDLATLANEACLAPTYFHKLFKKETGKNPGNYISDFRMKHAYNKITTSDIPIQELALRTGYREYETFSKNFKKHFDIAPHDLRGVIKQIDQRLNTQMNIYRKVVLIKNDLKGVISDIYQKKIQEVCQEPIHSENIKTFTVSKNTSGFAKKTRSIRDKYCIREH